MKFKIELVKALDQVMDEQVKNNNIEDINFNEQFKVSEMKLQEKALKKYSDKIKKQKAHLFWMLNKTFFKIIPYCTKSQRGIKGCGYDLMNDVKPNLMQAVKMVYVNK